MLIAMTTRAEMVVRAQGFTIGGVRILAGLMWLANLHWKVPTDFGEANGGGLYKYVAAGADNAPLAPYRWALRELVLPNFQLFGWFTLISEAVVAALLLIGYRSRLVALAGAAMAVPIGLSVLYYPRADEWAWSYLLMIGLHLLLWAVPSGDHLGVDGVLAGAPARSGRAMRSTGIVAVVVGALGLFVARSIDFTGKAAALLGSDAGFANADGGVTRRWELKFLFFNPLWALLTVACVALPQALAFGVASGSTAAAGLVTAIIAGVLIGILSGGANQISGPTGAMSAVLIVVAGRHGIQGVLVVGFLDGFMILLIGIFRLGKVVSLIPRPVITGFTSGIAVIISVGQIDNLLGAVPAVFWSRMLRGP